MKTYYDSFELCKSNRDTYIMPHTVMKSRYTNVKYHCEISWYFAVHCLLQSLRNYKGEAKIKPSKIKPWRCQGNKLRGNSLPHSGNVASQWLLFVTTARPSQCSGLPCWCITWQCLTRYWGLHQSVKNAETDTVHICKNIFNHYSSG